jgi:hypothetical protein
LVLFRACELPRALARLSLDTSATITERVSDDPVRDGYVAHLEIAYTDDAAPMRAGVDAFIARESARRMEPFCDRCTPTIARRPARSWT